MLCSFWLIFLVHFMSNPYFIHWFYFLPRSLSFLSVPMWYCVHCAGLRGGGGSHGWHRGVIGISREIMLMRNLTCQPEARCRVPVRIHVSQRTGQLSYWDQLWVRNCDRDCYLTVYSAPHVRNGFVYFICHGSTHLREYDQGFISLAYHQQK